MKTIGERIKAARKELGLTQKDLGKLVGVGASGVSQWENNTTEPRGNHLIRLCRALQKTAEYIVTGKGEVEEPSGYPLLDPETLNVWLGERIAEPSAHYIQSVHDRGDKAFCWRIADDAIKPVAPKGTIVFVDPDFVPPKDYDSVVILALIEKGGRYAVRRRVDDFGQVVFKSIDGDFRSIPESECLVIGYVVGMPEQVWPAGAAAAALKSLNDPDGLE